LTVGIEHQLHLLEHQIGHMLDTADKLRRRKLAVERNHALGDVLGQVADAFKIIRKTQGADNFAQIDRHRLAARDGEHRLFFDFALQCIDVRVPRGYALRQRGIALRQGIDRLRDLFLGKTAHLGNHACEILQVRVERLHGVVGHRVHLSLMYVGRRSCASRSGQ
jgi:hypothetical protein